MKSLSFHPPLSKDRARISRPSKPRKKRKPAFPRFAIGKPGKWVNGYPAMVSPGLPFITAADLKHFWRSDHYRGLSNNVLYRPAIVIQTPQ